MALNLISLYPLLTRVLASPTHQGGSYCSEVRYGWGRLEEAMGVGISLAQPIFYPTTVLIWPWHSSSPANGPSLFAISPFTTSPDQRIAWFHAWSNQQPDWLSLNPSISILKTLLPTVQVSTIACPLLLGKSTVFFFKKPFF